MEPVLIGWLLSACTLKLIAACAFDFALCDRRPNGTRPLYRAWGATRQNARRERQYSLGMS